MKISLHSKILISLLLAFGIGLSLNVYSSPLEEKPEWVVLVHDSCKFIGTLFLNALKMVVIPLIVTSIICGVTKIGAESNFKRLGLKTLGFYSLSGLLAVTVGLLCVNLLEPGIIDEEIRQKMLQNKDSFESEKMDSAMQ